VKPYECQICKRRYHKRRVLNEHYSFHMGKKLYQCKKCDKSYRYRKNFKIHAETHVEEFNSSYLCEICNKKFQLQYDYWNHITSKHVIVESQMAEVELREWKHRCNKNSWHCSQSHLCEIISELRWRFYCLIHILQLIFCNVQMCVDVEDNGATV